jgi:SAM-dependent methyltransferase
VSDDRLLAEQRAYYRARAPEYDEWWQRRGRFDRGSGPAEEWDRQVAQVAAALEIFGATGDVLELAGGTGWWTARLARTAGRLTVIDASPETLELNRQRVGRPDVDNRNDPHPTGEVTDPYVVHHGADLDLRRLHDGGEYQVVEVFYEPEELQSLLGHEGWTARLDATRWFIFGDARRTRP